jgi:8-oxo-dGTP pyrophosphatase MutT (NUDIX family)
MGETPIEAAIRELIEETDITLDRSDLESFGKLYIRKSHISYICHLFRAKLKQMPKVQLSFEHTAFQWVTPLEREKLPLILGSKELLALYDHSNR